MNDFSTDSCSDEDTVIHGEHSKYLYLPVKFYSNTVAALIDTGSSVNLISSELYNSIPHKLKTSINTYTRDTLLLANAQKISVVGTATIQVSVNNERHNINVNILTNLSNPLILGTSYLKDQNVVLNFKTLSIGTTQANVRSINRVTVPPNSEMIITGQLPANIFHGQQGFCGNDKYLNKLGLLISKSLVTVSKNKTVPVKLLNPGNEPIRIQKGKILAHFTGISPDDEIMKLPDDKKSISNSDMVNFVSQTADLINGTDTEFEISDGENQRTFVDNFKLDSHLSDDQIDQLKHVLCNNKDIFLTKDNPSLGHTDLVQHHLVLKPDFKPKHQRPYRLPPQKREILRHHLDELLEQGIIVPLDPNEDAPITSPIVLVTKRSKNASEHQEINREASLSQYRFCVDFRYLNSQVKHFSYAIPDLQELTESFTQRIPNYITSIDLSSGFFQMNIDSESTKYTAFNTCYGSFKFLRMPMGLSSSPSSFQLLMAKVLRGLTFQSCLCYFDDVLIFSETFSEHIADLQEIFGRLRSAGLKLNPKKCAFAQESCIYLGHHISNNGIKPPP